MFSVGAIWKKSLSPVKKKKKAQVHIKVKFMKRRSLYKFQNEGVEVDGPVTGDI